MDLIFSEKYLGITINLQPAEARVSQKMFQIGQTQVP